MCSLSCAWLDTFNLTKVLHLPVVRCRYVVVDNFISHEHTARVRAEALAFYRQGSPRSPAKAGHDCTDETDSISNMCCAKQGVFRKRPGLATTVQSMPQVCLWTPACPQLT